MTARNQVAVTKQVAAPNKSWEVALFEVHQTKKLKVSIPTIVAAANPGDDGGDGGGLELSSGASVLSMAQTFPQEELLAQEDSATKPAISNNSASVDDDYSTYVLRVISTEEHIPCDTAEECPKDGAVSWASNTNTNCICNFCEGCQVKKGEVGPMELFQSKLRLRRWRWSWL